MESVVGFELQRLLHDRYRVEREIARGGMASVFLATDLKHDRQVALKVMHHEVAMVLGRERFLREIRLTAKLSHPNILTVHDSGEAGDYLWYAMPFVEGQTLRQKLDGQPRLPVHEAVRLASETAEAIGYAHSLGVVHRDIKPANILLSRGHAVVADFGIAQAVDVARDDRLTSSGVALGTTSYMSPEQALAEEVDARTDVWALGAVLYEMLAGKPPFGIGGREVVTRALTSRPDRLRTLRPEVPEILEQVVERALSRDKTARYPDATAFAEALNASATGSTFPARKRQLKSPLLIGAIAVVAVAGGAALISFYNGAAPNGSGRSVGAARSSDSIAVELARQAKGQQMRRTAAGSIRAISLYSQAIARDSGFARAWSELARTANFAYSRAYDIPGFTQDSLIALAVAASGRAVELAPDDADTWLVKARTGFLVDPVAIAPRVFAIRKTLELDSGNAEAWHTLAVLRQELFDDAGALAAWKRAVALDPSDTQSLSFIALHYLWTGKPDSGVAWAERAIELDPTYLLARDAAGQLALEIGRPADAIRHYEVAMRLTSGRERANHLAMLAKAYRQQGDLVRAGESARKALEMIDASNPVKHEAAYVAAGLAAVGDTARAVRLLEAYRPLGDVHYQLHLKRDPGLKWLKGSWGKHLLLPDPPRL